MVTVGLMDRSGGGPVDRLEGLLITARRLVHVAVTSLLLASCGADRGSLVPEGDFANDRLPVAGGLPGLVIDFEAAPAPDLPITAIDARVGGAIATTVSLRGGSIRAAVGADGGTAARFPANAQSATGARAVLRVEIPGSEALSPGRGGFQFGVDLMYPEGSAGDTSGDDGDNLFQRGLFGDQGQFKLQVDHGRPACRIAGDQRETLVKARETLESDQWYRLLCQRSEGEVTIFVAELESASDRLTWESWSVADRSGAIPAKQSPVPVSIGGKLNRQGQIVREAPDQFSGVIDNVVFLSLTE